MITHHAYTFDAIRFHTMLANEVVRDGSLSLKDLHKLVVESAKELTDTAAEALHYLSYGDDWLAEDKYNSDYWYIVLLVNNLQSAPNINILNYNYLTRMLPKLGWTTHSIERLITGDNLEQMWVYALPDVAFEKYWDLQKFGGWLSFHAIVEMRRKLMLDIDRTEKLQQEVIIALEGYDAKPTVAKVKGAYENAILMLETALHRKHDLFLFRS